jgi:hypothetical protein
MGSSTATPVSWLTTLAVRRGDIADEILASMELLLSILADLGLDGRRRAAARLHGSLAPVPAVLGQT